MHNYSFHWTLFRQYPVQFSVSDGANSPALQSVVSSLSNLINLSCNPLKSSAAAITLTAAPLFTSCYGPPVWPCHPSTLLQSTLVHTSSISHSQPSRLRSILHPSVAAAAHYTLTLSPHSGSGWLTAMFCANSYLLWNVLQWGCLPLIKTLGCLVIM